MDTPLIVNLCERAAQPLSLVGGKAKNLMRLAETGASVPAGFCVTTQAYRTFVARNGLEHVIADSVREIQDSDESARAASRRIQQAFLSGILPTDVLDAIRKHYEQLSVRHAEGLPVAVRSSATAEDLSDASFAGIQTTVLNVRGLGPVIDALRSCWASLWTQQAISYRSRKRITDSDLAIAVIVQKMIPSRVAGVLFTIEPVTGNRDCLTVEACWGLGEALVSGNTIPDHYELDRATFRLRYQIYGRQDQAVECAEEGGTRIARVRETERRDPCLSAEQLAYLARTGLAIEKYFGSPQDIEWAIDANRAKSRSGFENIYFLQSRPITVLRPHSGSSAQAEPWESPVSGAIWVRQSGGVVEHLPAPASPLFATGQLPLICDRLDAQCPEMGVVTPAPTYTLINGYFYNRSDYRVGPGALLLPVNYWRAARKGARDWRARYLPGQLAAIAAASRFDLSGASISQLLRHIQKLFSMNARAWDNAVRASRTYVLTEPLFRRLFESLIRPITGGDAVTYLRGFESQTMAGEQVQWELARSARALPRVSERIRKYQAEEAWQRISADPSCRHWVEQFSEFCELYGHANASHDYLQATMADDPAKGLQSIRIRLESESENPQERQSRLALERETATAQALAKLQKHRLRKALFQWALSWAQKGASTREDIFFFALRGWPLARRAIVQLGKALVEVGVLACREDIFFLTWDELEAAAASEGSGNWQAKVAERRARHELRTSLTPPPRIPAGSPSTVRKRVIARLKKYIVGRGTTSTDGFLWGAPVSPGIVTGHARIICSVEELGRLEPGNILITRAATPEWTSTFGVAAGLVTDVGGPLSHSSIIAREFGIPSVMGVRIATTAIAEGQLVTIDGTKGSIQLH
ncbi:MAG: PEP/pyruvate-binding domain-containing protein [Bryobacteraceae bacterium]